MLYDFYYQKQHRLGFGKKGSYIKCQIIKKIQIVLIPSPWQMELCDQGCELALDEKLLHFEMVNTDSSVEVGMQIDYFTTTAHLQFYSPNLMFVCKREINVNCA